MNTIAFPEQSLVAVIEMVYSRCLTLCPRNSYGKLKLFFAGIARVLEMFAVVKEIMV